MVQSSQSNPSFLPNNMLQRGILKLILHMRSPMVIGVSLTNRLVFFVLLREAEEIRAALPLSI